MALREIMLEAKKTNVVDTGYFTYIGYKEKWKQAVINGKTARQYVSTLGRVYDPKYERLSSLQLNPYKYIIVSLNINGVSKNYRMNRIVLETFHGKPPEGMDRPESDHISGNTFDNSIENLQWLSKSDNVKKEMEARNIIGENNPNSKYTKEIAEAICKMLEENKLTIKEIAEKNNVEVTLVYDLKYQRAWKHVSQKYNTKKHSVLDVNYDPEIPKRINKLILAGRTNKEIREILNLENNQKTTDILSHHRKRLGKSIRKSGRLPLEVTTRISDMILSGKSNAEIYSELNLPHTKQMENAIGQRRLRLKNKGLI